MTETALTTLAGTTEPELELVVFPGAGAGPGSVGGWRTLLPIRWRLHAVCFPGRGTRFGEPVGSDPTPLIDEAVAAILDRVTAPILLFGHSLGGLWAREAADRLDPVALVTAGCYPPVPGHGIPPIMSTDEHDRGFTRHVLTSNGIDEGDILDQLVNASVPILQADMALTRVWRSPVEPLDCPILSYFGDEEPVPDRTWAEHTTLWAEQTTIPGDHLFYQQNAFAFMEDLARRLDAALVRTPRRTTTR